MSTVTLRTQVVADVYVAVDMLSQREREKLLKHFAGKTVVDGRGFGDHAKDAYEAILRKDYNEALLILHGMAFPKWPHHIHAASDLEQAMGRTQ